ncbi:MAG: sialidase family protein [Bacteroidales bacterium]|nr:sialidase family protein [Bacteroidales bacterium]
MSVGLDGDVKELRNGDVVASIYRGFYMDKNGKILPSGISFYKWNEAGVSWNLLGKIPFHPDLLAYPTGNKRMVWEFTEPAFAELRNGSLICVVRTSEEEKLTPMYRLLSKDGGRTWTKPIAFIPNGVKPRLLELGNGAIVLTSGRPGVQLRFDFDGTGENWTEAIDMLPFMNDDGSYTREVSCGYTSLLPIDKNSFFLVYSDFLEHDQQGEVRKAIKIRKVTVETK